MSFNYLIFTHFVFQSKQDRSFQDIQSHSYSASSTNTKQNDVTSSYRQACDRSKGTFFQLVSTKPEKSQEAADSGAFQRGKAYFEGLQSNERKSSSVQNEVILREKDEVSVVLITHEICSDNLCLFLTIGFTMVKHSQEQ